ncbi:sodium:proton antiporter [bacterium]|nr:sodium:proton antiporter [bacterium]
MNGMTPIVRVIARIVEGFIFLYGCYIVLYGHLSPGGGFAGGAVIAAGLILSRLAFGTTESQEKSTSISSSIFESSGGLLFLLIALLGIVVGGYFFMNLFPVFGKPGTLLSAGSIPLSNIAIAVKVAGAILTIFIVLASTKYILKD